MLLPTMRRLALLGLLALAACKTRLSDKPDLEVPPPDLTVPLDLSLPPDLLPPPDLTPPFYCRPIYVVDANTRELSGFVTELARFDHVGILNCPDANGGSPETMSIDLHGQAWVFYSSGNLYTVDLQTATCSPTMFDPRNINPDQGDPASWQTYGSSFSLNSPGSTDETLWVALGKDLQLAAIDPATLTFTRGPKFPNESELTGTALAELWLFAPGAQPASYIARIDKQSGQLDLRIPVPQITVLGNFAFAFWGGSFWIFNGDGPTVNGSRDTTVYRVDENTHQVTTILKNTRRHIVGAGVSGCAPLGLDR
jgi:hypothetical protein